MQRHLGDSSFPGCHAAHQRGLEPGKDALSQSMLATALGFTMPYAFACAGLMSENVLPAGLPSIPIWIDQTDPTRPSRGNLLAMSSSTIAAQSPTGTSLTGPRLQPTLVRPCTPEWCIAYPWTGQLHVSSTGSLTKLDHGTWTAAWHPFCCEPERSQASHACSLPILSCMSPGIIAAQSLTGTPLTKPRLQPILVRPWSHNPK